MALNPYRPVENQLQPAPPKRWWLVPFWVGTFEILIGLALGISSCSAIITAPIPGSAGAAYAAFALDILGFVVPGVMLQIFPRRWLGLLPQLAPLAIIAYSLLAWHAG